MKRRGPHNLILLPLGAVLTAAFIVATPALLILDAVQRRANRKSKIRKVSFSWGPILIGPYQQYSLSPEAANQLLERGKTSLTPEEKLSFAYIHTSWHDEETRLRTTNLTFAQMQELLPDIYAQLLDRGEIPIEVPASAKPSEGQTLTQVIVKTIRPPRCIIFRADADMSAFENYWHDNPQDLGFQGSEYVQIYLCRGADTRYVEFHPDEIKTQNPDLYAILESPLKLEANS